MKFLSLASAKRRTKKVMSFKFRTSLWVVFKWDHDSEGVHLTTAHAVADGSSKPVWPGGKALDW